MRLGPAGILFRLDPAGIFDGWTLPGHSAVGHCRHTLQLGTAGILSGWAVQGYSAAGHCRDTWWLGTAGILCGWALQGYSAVGHCRDTWWLGTAWILGGWSLKSASSRARTTSTLISDNPTARAGKWKKCLHSLPISWGGSGLDPNSRTQKLLPVISQQRLGPAVQGPSFQDYMPRIARPGLRTKARSLNDKKTLPW